MILDRLLLDISEHGNGLCLSGVLTGTVVVPRVLNAMLHMAARYVLSPCIQICLERIHGVGLTTCCCMYHSISKVWESQRMSQHSSPLGLAPPLSLATLEI